MRTRSILRKSSFQKVERADQRALAGTGTADDAEDFTRLNLQVDIGECDEVPVGNLIGFMEMLDANHGRKNEWSNDQSSSAPIERERINSWMLIRFCNVRRP